MKTISLKSQAILSKIGISLYKKRECSNLNDAKEIALFFKGKVLSKKASFVEEKLLFKIRYENTILEWRII